MDTEITTVYCSLVFLLALFSYEQAQASTAVGKQSMYFCFLQVLPEDQAVMPRNI